MPVRRQVERSSGSAVRLHTVVKPQHLAPRLPHTPTYDERTSPGRRCRPVFETSSIRGLVGPGFSNEEWIMQKVKEAVEDFLACRRIAVTGVSRTPANHGSNVVYKRLRDAGYAVHAVNPNAGTVEGDPSFPTWKRCPGEWRPSSSAPGRMLSSRR
jgi:hypothetical protein